MDYDGFKLGLRVSRIGMMTHFPLLTARSHDVNHTNALVEGFSGMCPADKAFIERRAASGCYLKDTALESSAPARKNMKRGKSRPVAKVLFQRAKNRGNSRFSFD